jgi:3-deoxy-7-phosphoheptulonate synthase
VFAGEARTLEASLAKVAAGNAFLLQAGDCAESFEEFSAVNIREKLRVILQMAVVLTYSLGVPVVKVGRIAGQFAKPRSSSFENVGGVELPSFRGHMVNDSSATVAGRVPNPSGSCRRTPVGVDAQPAARVHEGRLRRPHTRARVDAGVRRVEPGGPPVRAARERDRPRAEVHARLRRRGREQPNLNEVDVYTSHEALLLGYEEALTRQDSLTGGWYDCSAHMLWIGERTRDLDGAHIEFLRGVGNPVGCKIGPTTSADYVLELCERLNHTRVPGRLTLISRMGAKAVESALPPLLRAVRDAGHPVVWACDPMHANTYTTVSGHKTRDFNDICAEIDGFVRAHQSEGTWPGGIHVELTGDNVTECIGGADNILDSQLVDRYHTVCDPRLNARQSLDLAFHVAESLRTSVLA